MKRLLQAYQCADYGEARRQLREWYRTPLGEALMQREQALIRQLLPGLFGYHLLQLGGDPGCELLSESRISHRMIMLDEVDECPQPATGIEYLRGRSSQLPIASDTLDAVLLPHRLEYEGEPHQLLREVERMLIPEGHLLITGFNPLSQFGLRRAVQGWQDEAPWSGHFYTSLRLKDWLGLLGFDTVLRRYYFHRPPLHHRSDLTALMRMETLGQRFLRPLGGAYMLVAKKRVTTFTPIRPRWHNPRGLINVGLTEPTARRDKYE